MPDTTPHAPASSDALILIAEDEDEIAEILSLYLARSGLRSVHAANGREALALFAGSKPDLVLLDVHMPEVDGWRVLTEIRQCDNTPVIMLTAMDQDIDKLLGLRIGADDYVVKPFNPAEVAERVRAVLRRTRQNGGVRALRMLCAGPLQLDPESHEVSIAVGARRQTLALTLTEFRLLAQLMQAPRQVFSRAALLAACPPESGTQERTIDSHISKLRKKLEALGLEGVPRGVRGIGYRLWDAEDARRPFF